MATYSGSDKRLKYLFQNGGGGGASALVDLSDVNISSPSDGQVLIYDANNDVWINSSVGNPSSLASLSDVTLTNPTTGQVLTYNGTDWVNATGGGGSGHTYSTTEQVVGTWIDGKPIYEKTVQFNSGDLPNADSSVNISHGISDFGELISAEGFVNNGTSFRPLSNARIISSQAANLYTIGYVVFPDRVYIESAMDLRTYIGFITLRYTKSTT